MRDFKVYERRSPNAIQIICNVSTNFFYLSVECITNCIYNTHCNAIDVSGTYCRLIRGGDSLYTEQNVATTCQRFQIVRIFHLLTGVIFFFPKTCVVYNRKKFKKENNVVSVIFVVMWDIKAVTLKKKYIIRITRTFSAVINTFISEIITNINKTQFFYSRFNK